MAGVLAASTSSTSQSADTSGSTTDAINDLDLGTFLTLMITELQNQDPLNPLENKDMLAQLSQIRSVGSTDKLTKTLDSVLLGQNLTSATTLIGADISALSDNGDSVTGVVDRVSIDKGVPKLHVDNIAGVAPSGASGEIGAGTYGYRVVWQDGNGKQIGLDFSGDQAITTTGTAGVDQAIQLRNLPKTDGPKQVFRTDATGKAVSIGGHDRRRQSRHVHRYAVGRTAQRHTADARVSARDERLAVVRSEPQQHLRDSPAGLASSSLVQASPNNERQRATDFAT